MEIFNYSIKKSHAFVSASNGEFAVVVPEKKYSFLLLIENYPPYTSSVRLISLHGLRTVHETDEIISKKHIHQLVSSIYNLKVDITPWLVNPDIVCAW